MPLLRRFILMHRLALRCPGYVAALLLALFVPCSAGAQHEETPEFMRLSHIIELDNDTYINTISRLFVSSGGDFLLLDPHRSEAYLVPVPSEESFGNAQTYNAEPTITLAHEQCGMEEGFSPYSAEFTGPDDLIIYNRHSRPLLFDREGNCRARLSFPDGGELKRRYAEFEASAADTAGGTEKTRGIWTHEVSAGYEHQLRYQSFRRARADERLISLPDMPLPVMNSYQNGGGLFLHKASETLFLIGASSAQVAEVPLANDPEAEAADMKIHTPDYPDYRQNTSDLPAGLSPSRRIPRMVTAIQEYGVLETAYQLDERHLLLSYTRTPHQQPAPLDSDGLPISGAEPPPAESVSLLMLFDMETRQFAERAFPLSEDAYLSGAGNGFIYIARRSEEASIQRGIINPLIYAYTLTDTE
ncbi:MAG: hypothetical protein ACOC2C_09005 [Cyclonatronaceae bacterium]